MTLALTLVFGGYVAFQLATSALIARQALPPLLADDALPDAVVIVAARNEAATIGRCIAALCAQDYPADKLTIVVADDHSTDETEAAVHAAMGGDGPEVRYVRVPDPVGDLRGKAQALHTAIAATTAPVLLVTDADCAPVPTWARALASELPSVSDGMACGVAEVMPRPGRFFDRVQAVDWELLLGTMSAAAEAGAPTTGMGNSMALRREAYDAVGGYPALPFSVTEDFTLVQALVAAGRPVGFRIDPRSVVRTLPAEGVRATFEQRRRWARGGLDGDASVLVIYAVVFAVHALPLVALAVAPLAGLAALASKAAADLFRVATMCRRLGTRLDVGASLGATGFMTAYLIALPFVLLLRPEIGWKGRRH